MGEKSLPSSPVKASKGRNTKMMSVVAYRMDERTSADASAITSRAGRGSARIAFSRKRRNTFSTSTIASSTTMPMATASPPSVIEFTLSPNRSNTMIVIPIDKGMALKVIKVIRALKRKRNSTKATMIAPSRRASSRLPIDSSMKSDWRYRVTSSTPSGMERCKDAIASSTSAVSSKVSKPGDLVTLMITPG